jgi:uncharacterized protein (TIGR02147 family)
MKQKLPLIYDYVDFRKYLEEYREERARYDTGFTHYYICFCLGMKKSRSYFNNIIRGRKNIGPEIIEKLAGLLELSQDEENYFRALINYGQTKSASEKEFYFDQIISLNNTPRRIIDEDAYEYYKEWYHPIIREMLGGIDFKGQYAELAKKLHPPIRTAEARQSIKLLTRLGLVKQDEKGFLKPVDKVVSTNDKVTNHLVQQYQIKSLSRGQTAIMESASRHKTSTLTVCVSKPALVKIVQKMDQFRSAVRSIAHKDGEKDKEVFEIIVHAHRQTG